MTHSTITGLGKPALTDVAYFYGLKGEWYASVEQIGPIAKCIELFQGLVSTDHLLWKSLNAVNSK